MGTVGINFGAANSGKGFDVATTVTAILGAQRAIEDPWKAQLTKLTAQDTALSTIGTDLASLSTALGKLTDFTGVTAQKQGASSDTTQLELTGATSAASAGSHTVVVTSLATTSSSYSGSLAAADVLSGSITIKVGSGTAHTITVGSTSNKLNTLKAAINAAAIGVSASIVTDTNGSRLSLVSTTGGSSGSLAVTSNLTDTTTSNSSVAFTTTAGTNGSITVDSVPVSVAGNTVSTAIPGVTFQLLAAGGTPIQIQITNDTSSVATAFSNLVTAYNAVAKGLTTQEGKDGSGNAEPLYGSSTLALIQSQLSSAIFAGTASGTIRNVSQFGINFNNDGTLALNTDTLTTSLTNNFSDIVGFLQNANSFGTSFATTLNNLSSTSTTGVIKVALAQNSSQEARLNQNVTALEARLASQQVTLTAELNTANQILQAIPDQLDQVNQLYAAITGYNTKG